MNPSPPKISETTKHKKGWLWVALIALVVVPVTVIIINELIFFGRVAYSARQTLRNADAGFQRAKQTINPEELRAWALESIKRFPGTNYDSSIIPESEIPKYIRDLYPQPPFQTAVGQDQAGNQSVIFFWGGGFFGWTIEVGPTNLVPPTDQGSLRSFMWVPGIYYGRESPVALQ